VTVGYIDGSALVTILSPGPRGDKGAAVWASFDATCTHQFSELEVPSSIGRSLDRVAWIWALNSLSVIAPHTAMHANAIDLAWLGAPPLVAVHVAAAESVQVDHFVTADPIAESWATLRGLNVISL
jgi:hypothetical protein